MWLDDDDDDDDDDHDDDDHDDRLFSLLAVETELQGGS